jgi:hypothetical protein
MPDVKVQPRAHRFRRIAKREQQGAPRCTVPRPDVRVALADDEARVRERRGARKHQRFVQPCSAW